MRTGKQFHNMPVISVDEGRLLGRIQDLYLDQEIENVAGLYLGSQGMIRRRANLVTADNVVLYGVDAILVSSSEDITDDQAYPKAKAWRRRDKIHGAEIATPGGTRLGIVGDVVIEDNGQITGFQLSKTFVEGPLADKRFVGRSAILDIGPEDAHMTAELASLEQGIQGVDDLVITEEEIRPEVIAPTTSDGSATKATRDGSETASEESD